MARKNAWFKHYNTASTGDSFQRLRAERDFETMACYWMLLELVSFHEAEDKRGIIEIPKVRLHQFWNVSSNRALRIIGKIVLNFANTIRIETSEQSYKIFVPNWLELQENRGGKREAKTSQNSGEVRSEKSEVRNKIVEEDPATNFLFYEGKYFKLLPPNVKEFLISTYPKEFLEIEMLETEAFISANESKYIEKLGAFIPRNLQDKWQHQALKRKKQEDQSTNVIGMVADL